MHRKTRRRHVIQQSIVAAALAAGAVAYTIHLAHEPLQSTDLQIAAQSLHSYAAEAVMLAEQAVADNVYRPYVANEAQFLSEKARDVASTLTSDAIDSAFVDYASQELNTAHELRTELHELGTAHEDPLHLAASAQRLRGLSADMKGLEKQLRK
jgi:hypothetical protein